VKGLPLGFYRAIACPTVVASTQQHLIGVNAPFASTAMLLSEQRQRTSQQGLPPAVRDWPGDCRRLRDRAAGEVGKPRLLYRRLASALPTPESTGPDPPTRIVRVRPGNRRRKAASRQVDCLLARRVSARRNVYSLGDILQELDVGRTLHAGARHPRAERVGAAIALGAFNAHHAIDDDHDVGVGGVTMNRMARPAVLQAGLLHAVEDRFPLLEIGDSMPDDHGCHSCSSNDGIANTREG